MVRRSTLLAGLAVLLIGFPVRAEPPSVERLIEQLGSDVFSERQEATKALEALGSAPLELLRKATKSPDVEVRRRATALVKRIEQKLDSETALAAKTLRLNVRNMPLNEVVNELRRKSAYDVQLDPKMEQPGRKITLDTGDVTFWEALDKLCDKAGLVEQAPPAETEQPIAGFRSSSVVIRGIGGQTVANDIMKPDPPEKEEAIVLADGKREDHSAVVAGAMRIATTPAGTSVPNNSVGTNENMVALEMTLEPRLKWLQALNVRVTKAVDDQDQALTGKFAFLGKSAVPRGSANVIINGQPIYPDEPGPQGLAARLVPVKLSKGEKPAKILKELSGTVLALVQSPAEELVVVNNPIKAGGQAVRNAEAMVKVLEMSKSEDGLWTLRFHVESPPRAIEDSTGTMAGAFVMINGRIVSGASDEPLSALNFALFDDKGNTFEIVKATNTGKRAGAARELELQFQPAEGQGEPAKFVYTGRRTNVVEVPFTLKNVPLP